MTKLPSYIGMQPNIMSKDATTRDKNNHNRR